MVYQVDIKNNEKKTNFEISALLKNSVNHKEITWIRIYFFPIFSGSISKSKLNESQALVLRIPVRFWFLYVSLMMFSIT